MEKNNHTTMVLLGVSPGPWRSEYIADKLMGYSIIYDAKDHIVADQVFLSADAKFIASAPTEIARLRELVKQPNDKQVLDRLGRALGPDGNELDDLKDDNAKLREVLGDLCIVAATINNTIRASKLEPTEQKWKDFGEYINRGWKLAFGQTHNQARTTLGQTASEQLKGE